MNKEYFSFINLWTFNIINLGPQHPATHGVLRLIAILPSRDAFPSDISNIHVSILERCGKLKLKYFNGSITAFPIIETIANDITEYTATNIISITDGQLYSNKKLFLDSYRPAIDSALSVSRIGSNAQCRLIKVISVGLKNELTNYRIIDLLILLLYLILDHLLNMNVSYVYINSCL